MATKKTFGFKAAALLVAVAGGLSAELAQAVEAVGGSATNVATVVAATGCPTATTGNWTVLRTVRFQNPTASYCVATGSADAFRPSSTANSESFYYFTVSNTPTPRCDQGQERTLGFFTGTLLEHRVKEITTTGGWMAPATVDPGYFSFPAVPAPFSGHTVYFLARKATAATPNLTVDDASLTVTCSDRPLVPPLVLVPANPVTAP